MNKLFLNIKLFIISIIVLLTLELSVVQGDSLGVTCTEANKGLLGIFCSAQADVVFQYSTVSLDSISVYYNRCGNPQHLELSGNATLAGITSAFHTSVLISSNIHIPLIGTQSVASVILDLENVTEAAANITFDISASACLLNTCISSQVLIRGVSIGISGGVCLLPVEFQCPGECSGVPATSTSALTNLFAVLCCILFFYKLEDGN